MTEAWPAIEILGVPIACVDRRTALNLVEQLYETMTPATVAFANAHTLNLAAADEGYRQVLLSSDVIFNDGSGVGLAARLQGRRFPANLNGSDLNAAILARAAKKGWPVYLLGARPGVAEAAAQALRVRLAGLTVVGTDHGYFEPEAEAAVIERIRSSGAGLVMVAMGNPAQERWLADHLEATGARLGIGVGAFLDFSAGALPRAPRWMNRLGIEWLYRLGREPGRLWRRYIIGNPLFIGRVLRARLSGRLRRS